MSKLFNSILQGFKEFGEITNNKSLLNQIDEIKTSETFEEGTIHKSIYTIDYVDNTGASFKDRIKASSEEDALKKFNKKSKNFVNGVRKIKGHPYIDYLDDDASYNEIDDFTEDTVRKSNGKWTNRGDDGEEHGEFSTKAKADAQRKAVFAKGYKGENYQMKLKINEDSSNGTFTEKDFNDYVKHTEDDVRRIALSISRMMQEHDEYYELFENLIDELVDILKNDSGMFQTESLKLKESTNSLDDYKVYEILINTLVPNSINLARHLSPNGKCYNEIVDVLKKNGLNLAEQWIDYKENPELTKRLHDMGIVHGNSTIEELTDKVLKKLDDNGYDTSDKDVINYAEAAAELIINDVNQDIDAWYSETLINYPEDLEELPKK